MCGIVGFTGNLPAKDILISGLEQLEYRGYDSAGIAVLDDEKGLLLKKKTGHVADLREAAKEMDTAGTCGIGHTRWATHGGVTEANAHPHNCGTVTLIHNGIIENYADIKQKLIEKGVAFQSDTDTEVLVQLVEYIMEKKQLPLLEAVQVAL